jgi:hypothetical protein
MNAKDSTNPLFIIIFHRKWAKNGRNYVGERKGRKMVKK